METTRRGFLGTLAAAPVGFQQLGRSLAGQPMSGQIGRLRGGSEVAGACDSDSGVDPWEFYRTFGVPEFVLDELRENAEPQRCDPDLDVLRAVSPVAKYRIQHKRNLDRQIAQHLERPMISKMRDEFVRKHGLNWWW